jgi:hypothetical protein
MKRVMPFAQAAREKIDTVGVQALNLTLEFDEMEVLSRSIVYLESTLDVSVKPFRLFLLIEHIFATVACCNLPNMIFVYVYTVLCFLTMHLVYETEI